MEIFEKHLQQAIKSLKLAGHITYVTFPLVNEKRLLLKIFDEVYMSIICSINAILHYEYFYKKIKLYKNSRDNLATFTNKCAKKYSLTNEQTKIIKEIIEINKKYKKSAMEFVKKDKLVILSDNLVTQTLDINLINKYLLLAKELVVNVNKRIKI